MLDQENGTGFVLAVARATLLPHRLPSIPGSLMERVQVEEYDGNMTLFYY